MSASARKKSTKRIPAGYANVNARRLGRVWKTRKKTPGARGVRVFFGRREV
jgi:hypothetical protein